ncbi:MAG: peptide chain release factor 2 [Fidelibacterota bacterium]
MDTSELKERFHKADKRFQDLRGIFDLSALQSTLSELKKKTVKEDFWDRSSRAQSVLKKISAIEKELSLWERAQKKREDMEVFLGLVEEEEGRDGSLYRETAEELASFEELVDELEIKLTLNDPKDQKDAILTIHPGAGGTESQDWASMLYRMYVRWIERHDLQYDVIDYQPGEEAGIKDVTLEVKGENAYGLLKSEMGVHRLVRISPFDASSRRHTSFASVFLYPSMDEEIEIAIKPDELRIDTYRASGAGGQHVNKTDSAVRITHLPTGTVVQCQNERSQHKNKANAMKILKLRLYQKRLEEKEKSMRELESQKKDIGWGSQIRSYVFHPYTLVKDHRTDVQVGDAEGVLDGDLDVFIRAYLLQRTSS